MRNHVHLALFPSAFLPAAGGGQNDAASGSMGGATTAAGSAADSEAVKAAFTVTTRIFHAIRKQGWHGIPVPRELQIGVYALVNPVWSLPPPLPSPLSEAVLHHHTDLTIDSSDPGQRTSWQQIAPQTAHELGKHLINLKRVRHRFPRTAEGAEGVADGFHTIAQGWCRGTVIALVEGHVVGRRMAREKEGPSTTMSEGSLESLSFESVPIPNIGQLEAQQLSDTNADPPPAAPSQSINLPALTEVTGVQNGHSVFDGRGWRTPAVETVTAPDASEIQDIRPFVATTRSLADLTVTASDPFDPSEMAELFGYLPVGQQGSVGPLASLRRIRGCMKLYGLDSTDLRIGLEDLQRVLVQRGCSRSLDAGDSDGCLCIVVDRIDCHSLILNELATFRALASLIDATVVPGSLWRAGKVKVFCAPSPLPSSRMTPRLVSSLLESYNMRLDTSHSYLTCPKIDTLLPGVRPTFRYVWNVTPQHLAGSQGGINHIGRQRGLDVLMFERSRGCSIAIQCAEGWTPLANAVAPPPPELCAFDNIFPARAFDAVGGLTVFGRIGLPMAGQLLSRLPSLEDLQLEDMLTTDVLDLLSQLRAWTVPTHLVLGALQTADGQQQQQQPLPVLKRRLQKVEALTASGDVAMRLAASLTQQMPSLQVLRIAGSETEARQVLLRGGFGAIKRLSLGFMSGHGPELIEAEDQREGIRLGDHRDRLPHIDTIEMHVDVPSEDIVEPGAFILSSIWSILEMQSISQLTVVLPEQHHLDDLNAAVQRRLSGAIGQVHIVEDQLHIVMMATDIAALCEKAFAHSSAADVLEALVGAAAPQRRLAMLTNLAATVNELSSMVRRYLPSVPPGVSAEALAIDFAARMRTASPMSVIDPPYAPRRLMESLVAAMRRRGMRMKPMMRLHGNSACRPSPSAIACASQLVAVLQTTGKQITGIELLYRATEHGDRYTDMLTRVGGATCLLFLVRSNGDMHGCFIDDSIKPPPPPHVETPAGPRFFNDYETPALIFKASGHSPIPVGVAHPAVCDCRTGGQPLTPPLQTERGPVRGADVAGAVADGGLYGDGGLLRGSGVGTAAD
ncbi:unnamed protein product [Vitrella brassicaformis CCMP3155]|uniref:TLDc domain-containing protein n=1 Tax=Vitrella brassicaformis (strain CCMP3155) TaxID=1169540 RepID=A0A0G4FHA7_VITBC|nr:unnamed protein product [Vitrella brassicaformis CCMP3155]|eukprot:CEM12280.1 unnamed protein product [Vitrella brassicaformis CCMP3155]